MCVLYYRSKRSQNSKQKAILYNEIKTNVGKINSQPNHLKKLYRTQEAKSLVKIKWLSGSSRSPQNIKEIQMRSIINLCLHIQRQVETLSCRIFQEKTICL